MFNKKRLVMIAVAASMVLPTNLTYLSMANSISVFAADEADTSKGTITSDAIPDNFTVGTQTVGKENRNVILLSGNYELTSNITITKGQGDNDGPMVVENGHSATLKLNGHTITSDASGVFKVYGGGNLVIEGPGTIVCNSSAANNAAVIWTLGENPRVTVKGGVELKVDENASGKNIHGIAANSNVSGGTISVENSTITVKDGCGVYTNGLIVENGPTIQLNNNTIEASEGVGIYQAGVSTITVNNGSITGNCGIETRAGELNVSGTTVTGGNEAFDVKPEGNAATTENAGIAIAQHTTDKPITVTIDKAKISGAVALSITDPQDLQKDNKSPDDNIKISVSNSTLSGDEYAVAYTEDTIKFELKDTTLSKGEIAQLVEVESKTNDQTIFSKKDGSIEEKNTSETPQEDLPYEITTTPKPTSGGGNKKPSKPKPEEPSEEPMTPVGTPTAMYRLYNKLTGEHLYTIDKNERDNLLTSDTWKDEGEGWIAPSVSDYPVYRLLNPNNGDHHYTTDKNEFDTLPSYGWVAEGVAFFSADKDNSENVLLHRLYNPNATGAGSHHYTADTNERDTLVEKGWTYEGLAWAGLPANK